MRLWFFVDNRRENSLVLLTQNFVKLFLCSTVSGNMILLFFILLSLIYLVISHDFISKWFYRQNWFPLMKLQSYCLGCENSCTIMFTGNSLCIVGVLAGICDLARKKKKKKLITAFLKCGCRLRIDAFFKSG